MWLLDANMDVHLVQTLNELGVSCDTAANRGWKALEWRVGVGSSRCGLYLFIDSRPTVR